jgi:hypothetical protein
MTHTNAPVDVKASVRGGPDKFPHSLPHSSFNRIEPIAEKLGSRLSFTLRGMRLRDIAGHGVISGPALQRRMIRG